MSGGAEKRVSALLVRILDGGERYRVAYSEDGKHYTRGKPRHSRWDVLDKLDDKMGEKATYYSWVGKPNPMRLSEAAMTLTSLFLGASKKTENRGNL